MRRILVVDDSATMRSLYKQLLSHMKSVTLHLASDGRQGLEMFDSVEPHLVFLDINMPEMNGLEVLGELSRTGRLARAPVVLVTTEGKTADVERGIAAGATEYVTKPFRLDVIRTLIDRLVPAEAAPGQAPATGTGGAA